MNNYQEKEELLEEEPGENRGLDISTLITVFLSMAVLLGFVIPKIYIASNIYYKSLEIEREKGKLLILEDERRDLELELEQYRFRNDVEK